jgi:hypothetical protein
MPQQSTIKIHTVWAILAAVQQMSHPVQVHGQMAGSLAKETISTLSTQTINLV